VALTWKPNSSVWCSLTWGDQVPPFSLNQVRKASDLCVGVKAGEAIVFDIVRDKLGCMSTRDPHATGDADHAPLNMTKVEIANLRSRSIKGQGVEVERWRKGGRRVNKAEVNHDHVPSMKHHHDNRTCIRNVYHLVGPLCAYE
jgi:hypothetical protein